MVRQQKNEELMAAGVTLIDPATTYIDADVEVGADTVIHPCVFLEGSTKIGAACEIHAGARIVNSTIGDRVCDPQPHRGHRFHSRGRRLRSGRSRTSGPGPRSARTRTSATSSSSRRRVMGNGAKANHLAYLGDATIGAKTNVGAGTITCNYDGEQKHQTVIGDDVLRRQQQHARRAGDHWRRLRTSQRARRSPTDVPAGALAIGRARQENKDGWVERSGKSQRTEGRRN